MAQSYGRFKMLALIRFTCRVYVGTGGIRSKQEQWRGYQLWATSVCTSGT